MDLGRCFLSRKGNDSVLVAISVRDDVSDQFEEKSSLQLLYAACPREFVKGHNITQCRDNVSITIRLSDPHGMFGFCGIIAHRFKTGLGLACPSRCNHVVRHK